MLTDRSVDLGSHPPDHRTCLKHEAIKLVLSQLIPKHWSPNQGARRHRTEIKEALGLVRLLVGPSAAGRSGVHQENRTMRTRCTRAPSRLAWDLRDGSGLVVWTCSPACRERQVISERSGAVRCEKVADPPEGYHGPSSPPVPQRGPGPTRVVQHYSSHFLPISVGSGPRSTRHFVQTVVVVVRGGSWNADVPIVGLVRAYCLIAVLLTSPSLLVRR